MKKNLLMFSALVMLIVASCSKSKVQPTVETKCLVKMVESTYKSGTFTETNKYFYTYNDKDQVVKIAHGSESSSEFETFTYENNKVTYKSNFGEVEVYNLDANGRILTAVEGNNVITFKYNTAGQLTEAVGDDTEKFSYQGGNLISASFGNSVWSTFTYGNDASSNYIVSAVAYGENFLDFNGHIGQRVMPFIGKTSVNLPIKIVTNPSIPEEETHQYAYTKDEKGNVISVRVTTTGFSNETIEHKFNYSCQ